MISRGVTWGHWTQNVRPLTQGSQPSDVREKFRKSDDARARHSRRDTISTRFSTPSNINIPDQRVITRHRRPPLECGRHFDRFEPEFQNRGLTSLKERNTDGREPHPSRVSALQPPRSLNKISLRSILFRSPPYPNIGLRSVHA